MDTQKGIPVSGQANEEIIENLETCCLCGTKLRFSHQTDYLNLQVHEETTCPACGIKNKALSFILQ
jgi:uncharacterized Zn-finger protein